MNLKTNNAVRTTITRDQIDFTNETNNIYESIVVMSKRANQISQDVKEELASKLSEFATHQDNLEEIFENREQIEVSRHYEKMPKAHSIALQEFLEDKIYYRKHVPEVNEQ
jgi:DNA-directed RNA polymerase subunit K/omega